MNKDLLDNYVGAIFKIQMIFYNPKNPYLLVLKKKILNIYYYIHDSGEENQ